MVIPGRCIYSEAGLSGKSFVPTKVGIEINPKNALKIPSGKTAGNLNVRNFYYIVIFAR